MRNSIIAILVLLICSSCGKTAMKMYGFKKHKNLTDEQIVRYAKKHNFNNYNIYKTSDSYEPFIKELKPTDKDTADNNKALRKALSQPLQYMLFDSTGKLIVHTINCYAGGFPNLQWNRDGAFEQFPPRPLVPFEDNGIYFQQIQPHVSALDTSTSSAKYDYTCIVFWDRFMGRQSNRLIKYALKNIEEERKKGTKINVLLVNNDNMYVVE